TPKEIILDLQLRDAQQLLLYSDLLIKNIASQIGMSSQEYFSKFFKKRTGYSPTEFRKFHK
ncbi:MAG: helix-turn-helix transcriptional regulator, partial [Atopostipes sp.]|nr:helix-turn-helix transcriptional regulator [Atopostipes sp.]